MQKIANLLCCIYAVKPILQLPVNNLIYPFLFVRSYHLNVVVGVTFHHAAFFVFFKQYFTCLSGMLLVKVLGFHVRQITQLFIAFVPYWYGNNGPQRKC